MFTLGPEVCPSATKGLQIVQRRSIGAGNERKMRMSVSPRRTLLFTRTNSQSLQVLGGLIIEKRGTCFSVAVRELLVALFAGKTRATGTAVTLSFLRS